MIGTLLTLRHSWSNSEPFQAINCKIMGDELFAGMIIYKGNFGNTITVTSKADSIHPMTLILPDEVSQKKRLILIQPNKTLKIYKQ